MSTRKEIRERSIKRALLAVELRRAGMTLKEVGKHIGVSGPVGAETARAAIAKGEAVIQLRAIRQRLKRA